VAIIKKDISQNWRTAGEDLGNPRRPGNPPMRRLQEIDMLTVHATSDEDLEGKDVDAIIRYHTKSNHVCNGERGCWTICYHYYIEDIGKDTIVWKTVPENIITFHAGKWNKRAVGVVVDKRMTDVVTGDKYKALVQTLADLCEKFDLNPKLAIVGHRNLYWSGWEHNNSGSFVQKTQCPGILPIEALRKDVAKVLDERGYIIIEPENKAVIYKDEEFYTYDVYNYLSSSYNYLPNREKAIKEITDKTKGFYTTLTEVFPWIKDKIIKS
jgi:hypothetical protein